MFKRIWKDPVWSAVIAGLVLALALSIWAQVRGLWPAVGRTLESAASWTVSESKVANWLLLLMGLCVLAVLVVAGLLLWTAFTRSASDQQTAVHTYVEDRFLGLVWRWKYGRDGTIYDLSVFCPACDYQIRPVTMNSWMDPESVVFECDDCGHKVGPVRGSQYDVESQVERKIQKNLRSQLRSGTEA